MFRVLAGISTSATEYCYMPLFVRPALPEELFLSMDHPRVARLLDVYQAGLPFRLWRYVGCSRCSGKTLLLSGEAEGRMSLVMECMEG